MGMNLIASTKRPIGHQKNTLIHIPKASCYDLDSYNNRETNGCYAEWIDFEENCTDDNMTDLDCWTILNDVFNPEFDPSPPDDPNDFLLLAAKGQSEVEDSSFGYGIAAGVSIGAVLGLTALFAMEKCKKLTSDDFIRA